MSAKQAGKRAKRRQNKAETGNEVQSHLNTAEKLVLIDATRHRVVMCHVVSTEPLSGNTNLGRFAGMLVRTGHRVMLAGEMTESIELSEAGD